MYASVDYCIVQIPIVETNVDLILDENLFTSSTIFFISDSQPGVPVPPGVHEKSQGVCHNIISLRITLILSMKQLTNAH